MNFSILSTEKPGADSLICRPHHARNTAHAAHNSSFSRNFALDSPFIICYNAPVPCQLGGIGRRARLKIEFFGVWVRVPQLVQKRPRPPARPFAFITSELHEDAALGRIRAGGGVSFLRAGGGGGHARRACRRRGQRGGRARRPQRRRSSLRQRPCGGRRAGRYPARVCRELRHRV